MESATIDIKPAPRSQNLRAYLAGGGATAALVAAAVVVFLGVAAFVGFKGLPFGADGSPDSTLNLAGVPQAAAAAAAPTAGAVAATPATPSAAAAAEILAALPADAIAAILPGLGTNPADGGSNGPGTPVDPTPSSGALGPAVGGLENAAGNLGLNLPPGDLTDDVTAPLDKTVTDTVNGAGGLLGDDHLGDNVTGALNQTTNGLLGQGGPTDQLLGGK